MLWIGLQDYEFDYEYLLAVSQTDLIEDLRSTGRRQAAMRTLAQKRALTSATGKPAARAEAGGTSAAAGSTTAATSSGAAPDAFLLDAAQPFGVLVGPDGTPSALRAPAAAQAHNLAAAPGAPPLSAQNSEPPAQTPLSTGAPNASVVQPRAAQPAQSADAALASQARCLAALRHSATARFAAAPAGATGEGPTRAHDPASFAGFGAAALAASPSTHTTPTLGPSGHAMLQPPSSTVGAISTRTASLVPSTVPDSEPASTEGTPEDTTPAHPSGHVPTPPSFGSFGITHRRPRPRFHELSLCPSSTALAAEVATGNGHDGAGAGGASVHTLQASTPAAQTTQNPKHDSPLLRTQLAAPAEGTDQASADANGGADAGAGAGAAPAGNEAAVAGDEEWEADEPPEFSFDAAPREGDAPGGKDAGAGAAGKCLEQERSDAPGNGGTEECGGAPEPGAAEAAPGQDAAVQPQPTPPATALDCLARLARTPAALVSGSATPQPAADAQRNAPNAPARATKPNAMPSTPWSAAALDSADAPPLPTPFQLVYEHEPSPSLAFTHEALVSLPAALDAYAAATTLDDSGDTGDKGLAGKVKRQLASAQWAGVGSKGAHTLQALDDDVQPVSMHAGALEGVADDDNGRKSRQHAAQNSMPREPRDASAGAGSPAAINLATITQRSHNAAQSPQASKLRKRAASSTPATSPPLRTGQEGVHRGRKASKEMPAPSSKTDCDPGRLHRGAILDLH